MIGWMDGWLAACLAQLTKKIRVPMNFYRNIADHGFDHVLVVLLLIQLNWIFV